MITTKKACFPKGRGSEIMETRDNNMQVKQVAMETAANRKAIYIFQPGKPSAINLRSIQGVFEVGFNHFLQ